MLLALDTSTHFASFALCNAGELYFEHTWNVSNNHSVEFLSKLDWLTQENNISLSSITSLAVALGPGSFNGVRVGVTVAKSLAFALSIPVIGVSSLDIMANVAAPTSLPICAIQSAGRGEFYAAFYLSNVTSEAELKRNRSRNVKDDSNLEIKSFQRISEYQIISADELSASIKKPTIFVGDINEEIKQGLKDILGNLAIFYSSLLSRSKALSLAEIALLRLGAGDIDDPLTLQPMYMRRPSITVSKKVKHMPEALIHKV